MKKQSTGETEELKKQIEEWKSKYLRALADYQNLEKRSRQAAGEVRRFAAEGVLERLLPVVDTLSRAKAHINDQGFNLALKELQAVLQEQGVERIGVVGKQFNPHEMECIEVVDGEDNIVVEELLSGYRIGGKILRVAQVKVGRMKESTNAQSTNEKQNN